MFWFVLVLCEGGGAVLVLFVFGEVVCSEGTRALGFWMLGLYVVDLLLQYPRGAKG